MNDFDYDMCCGDYDYDYDASDDIYAGTAACDDGCDRKKKGEECDVEPATERMPEPPHHDE